MAVTVYPIDRIGLPCTQCKQESSHLVREAIGRDRVTCTFCGAPIDLQSPDIQTALNKKAYFGKRTGVDVE